MHAAVRAYGAGAGILATVNVQQLQAFTGEHGTRLQFSQGGGRAVMFMEDSYINLDNHERATKIRQECVPEGDLGMAVTNSTINDVKCNAIDTNSHKETGNHPVTRLNIED